MKTLLIIAPALVFVLGLVEALTILPSGQRARRVVLILSITGLVLYVGGYVTGLIGDHLQPGVDSWCSGPISTVGIVMMVIGLVGAVIMLPVELLTAILCRKKIEANNELESVA
jgi:hypothetical protein